MYDQLILLDMDGDGDLDFTGTRGNSERFDGVFWLEQVRTPGAVASFQPARQQESEELPLKALQRPGTGRMGVSLQLL